MGEGTLYTIIHGRWGEADILHWSAFPRGEMIDHYLLRDTPHDVTGRLRDEGLLFDVVEAAHARDRTAMGVLMSRVKGQLRLPGETAETHPNPWYKREILKIAPPAGPHAAAE